jgi:hypothetical protein
MKSHTGGTVTLGKGSPYSACNKQKLNTKSSTEAELVEVSNCMPQALWTRYFLEAQGYDVSDSIICQDNQSAILLLKSGVDPAASNCTRQINIRHVFVTDCVANREVSIEYCPIDNTLADFFTKPLQGSTFQKFRNQILNLSDYSPHVMSTYHRSVLENQSN